MDMIERVAKAIYEARRGGGSWEVLLQQRSAATEAERWQLAARAAIEAMREPTEEQYHALCATNKMWAQLDSKTVWQTYIDAALGKPTSAA